ncbi:hypothetical protein HYDPIDRAFT_111572 [Hydnomerulius pinastri MD-312]|uniref:Uncharacterized protein n=1 Tax=Hydnomerulius pinastri MD-312 TaxID=994086 RepID=A0A0C9W1T2_9AGAM|nr:hypothetical protein HYDPIDRAFT_111572 [Hydnomerulius pinastri MD-312]
MDEAVPEPEADIADGIEEPMAIDEERDEDAPADLPPPALTRPLGPQTPTLQSLKHLFPQPKPSAVVNTPAVKSMRDLFRSACSEETGTPRMDGMRGMFLQAERERQVTKTPVFEGVGEMMQTPPGYREDDTKDDEPANEEVAMEEIQPPPRTAPRKAPVALTTTTARRRTPRVNASTSKVVAEQPAELPPLAEETRATEAAPVPPEPRNEAPVPRKARLLRGRKATTVDDEDEAAPEEAEPAAVVATEPKASRSRKVKTEADTETTALRKLPARSKATPIPEVIVETRAARSLPTKAKSRLPAKTTQPTTRTVTPTEQPGRSARPARKVTTAVGTRAATGRVTPNAPGVDDDESDPLDSIGQPDDPPIAKRRTRTVPAPKVKQEEAETAPTTTRRRAATASTSKPVAPSTTSRAKPVAPKKKPVATAATKAVAESGSESGDKENTPSREDEEPAQDVPKTTRAKKGTAALKAKEVEKEAEPPKPSRTTRVTRARN